MHKQTQLPQAAKLQINWFEKSIINDATDIDEVKNAYRLKCEEYEQAVNELHNLKAQLKTLTGIVNQNLPF